MGVRVTLAGIAGALVLGGAGSVAGPSGPGVEFDGKVRHAVVENGAAFDLESLSVSAWVKLRQTSGSQVFMGRGVAASLFTFYLFRDKVRMLIETRPGSYSHATAEPPEPDTWVHYLGTYDGESIRIYRNGELAGTTAARGRLAHSKTPLLIGALSAHERHVDGWLEDLAVWSRALGAEDVAAEYRETGSSGPESRVAWWSSANSSAGMLKNGVADKLHARLYDTVPPRGRPEPGYRGIWYSNQPSKDEYKYKYSGGLGTYCAKHIPLVVYSREANKTFFCYGGTAPGANRLWHMVSHLDHATGTVPQPTFLLDKNTDDAHDNPVMQLDRDGRIWIFSSSHGTGRPSYLHRSVVPYDVSRFEHVLTTNFSYTQPWYLPRFGFVFLHTLYKGGRFLHCSRSADGVTWDGPTLLSKIDQGHYQVSWAWRDKVGTAFNYHPAGKGLNWRTNLYYMQTVDGGESWQTVGGVPLRLPLDVPGNPALVHDYAAEKLNVYMKDLNFDAEGNPIILFLTSKGYEAGPKNGPRVWTTARWTGEEWQIRGQIQSDNNYDSGCLHVESDGAWRLIAPTETGPQPFNPGGEVAMWISRDLGGAWTMHKQLTHGSPYNHTYCRRPVNAHPGFYALWADGHGRQPSESSLYFTDKEGTHVWRLPRTMTADRQKPEVAW